MAMSKYMEKKIRNLLRTIHKCTPVLQKQNNG